jgi:hypothetical protein
LPPFGEPAIAALPGAGHAVGGENLQRMCSDEFGNVIFDSNSGFQPFGFAGDFYTGGFSEAHLSLEKFANMYLG